LRDFGQMGYDDFNVLEMRKGNHDRGTHRAERHVRLLRGGRPFVPELPLLVAGRLA